MPKFTPSFIVTGAGRTGSSLALATLMRLGVPMFGLPLPPWGNPAHNPEFWETNASLSGHFDKRANGCAVKIKHDTLAKANVTPGKVIVTIRRPSSVLASRLAAAVPHSPQTIDMAFIEPYRNIIAWVRANAIKPLVIDFDAMHDDPAQLDRLAAYAGLPVTDEARANIRASLRHHVTDEPHAEADAIYAEILSL